MTTRRHSAWWMRWLCVETIPAYPIAGYDAHEYVSFGCATRWGARRAARRYNLRAVSRREWEREH